jgi:hypothetical protein
LNRLLATFVFMSLAAASERAGAASVFERGPVRLLVGGEASASLAKRDRGFFNDQEYGQNTLRLFRLRLTTELALGAHAAVLGELRHTNDDEPRVYALYLRLRPWAAGPLDIQAGQLPPVFGSYPRRAYVADNPLIGEPLAYQYLTSLRADAAPGTVGDLIEQQGSGWLVRYPYGDPAAAPGLPLVSSLRWDTGVSARVELGPLEAAAALTQGSPSRPRVRDDNDGKGVAARIAWRPAAGWVVGASAARGRYVERGLEREIGRGERVQRALGADAEYSRGHWIFRAEAVWASWDAPIVFRARDTDLRAAAYMLEARLKVAPGLTVAARADRLVFGRLTTAIPYDGTHRPSWEAPVTRLEMGAAYALRRNVTLKGAFQHDRREGGDYGEHDSFLAGQVVLWF